MCAKSKGHVMRVVFLCAGYLVDVGFGSCLPPTCVLPIQLCRFWVLPAAYLWAVRAWTGRTGRLIERGGCSARLCLGRHGRRSGPWWQRGPARPACMCRHICVDVCTALCERMCRAQQGGEAPGRGCAWDCGSSAVDHTHESWAGR